MLTEVRAARMVYTEENRLTHYTGGVTLNRPGTHVTSNELRAYLAEAGADSRVEKAIADGSVTILSTAKDRTRTGTGEHAEYFVGEQKVVLNGPWVKMVERIFASELEDWPAILAALQETGEEFRQGKITLAAGSTEKLVPETK